MPVVFIRTQFPVRPAFAFIINRAQGHTFQCVGIHLPKSVFAHGQIYVAASRVGERAGVAFLVPQPETADAPFTTMNVVYPEVLQHVL